MPRDECKSMFCQKVSHEISSASPNNLWNMSLLRNFFQAGFLCSPLFITVLQCCILLLRISSEVDSMMWWFSLISCHTRSLEWVFFSIFSGLIYQISLLKTNKCISFGSTSYRHSGTQFFQHCSMAGLMKAYRFLCRHWESGMNP